MLTGKSRWIDRTSGRVFQTIVGSGVAIHRPNRAPQKNALKKTSGQKKKERERESRKIHESAMIINKLSIHTRLRHRIFAANGKCGHESLFVTRIERFSKYISRRWSIAFREWRRISRYELRSVANVCVCVCARACACSCVCVCVKCSYSN